MPMDGRRPDRADRRCAGGLDRDASERRDRRGDRALLLPTGRSGAQPRRVRARELPVRALPVPGAARPRGRRVRGRRGDRRADRRAHAPRPDQPRPLQGLGDPGRRADRAPRARGRRARDPRLLPVGGDRPGRRHGARGRLRRRRVGEVALRRARATAGSTSGPTSRSASSRRTRAGRRTTRPFAFEEEMEYASGAARFLTGTPNPAAHFAGTAGYDLDRGDRRRADPRELAPPDRRCLSSSRTQPASRCTRRAILCGAEAR